MYFLRVLPFRLQQVKDAKALRECQINYEKDQTNITTAEISKKKTFKIYDESGFTYFKIYLFSKRVYLDYSLAMIHFPKSPES